MMKKLLATNIIVFFGLGVLTIWLASRGNHIIASIDFLIAGLNAFVAGTVWEEI